MATRIPIPVGLVLMVSGGGMGCRGDTADKESTVHMEVRPVAWSSAGGELEGWAEYAGDAHIHATSAELTDHRSGVTETRTARLDAHGYRAEEQTVFTPGGTQEVLASAFDPATALPDSVSIATVGSAVRTVSHYERDAAGRLRSEVWELWDTVGSQSAPGEELVRVFPLAELVPAGDHGDYFSIIASETRYTSAGNVHAVRVSSGGTVDRPQRFESDTNGDGVVDQVEFAAYELDASGRPTAIHLGCPTEACDRPEQSFVVELENGRLARLQVWEPTDSAGTLSWRSTVHFLWADHPFGGPTGPHLDLRRTSPDNQPLSGWEERTWDADGWTTLVFNQSEEVVDTIWVDTEPVSLTLR